MYNGVVPFVNCQNTEVCAGILMWLLPGLNICQWQLVALDFHFMLVFL